MTNEIEAIQNPSWNVEHHSICPTGWRLRLAYWGDATPHRKMVWENHVDVCQRCKEYLAANTVNPEVES